MVVNREPLAWMQKQGLIKLELVKVQPHLTLCWLLPTGSSLTSGGY